MNYYFTLLRSSGPQAQLIMSHTPVSVWDLLRRRPGFEGPISGALDDAIFFYVP